MIRPAIARVMGSGATTKSPRKREPLVSCAIPTIMGPIVAAAGKIVRISPMDTVTSLGGNFISIGIVESIGGTAMAKIPIPNKKTMDSVIELVKSRKM